METAPTDPKKSKPSDNYLKYSGLGIQLFGSIGLCGWGGHLIDKHFNFKFPACLLILVMASFIINIVLIFRSLNKD